MVQAMCTVGYLDIKAYESLLGKADFEAIDGPHTGVGSTVAASSRKMFRIVGYLS